MEPWERATSLVERRPPQYTVIATCLRMRLAPTVRRADMLLACPTKRGKANYWGSTISNTAPWSFRAAMVPPCRSMMALTMESPRPLPPDAFREASLL